MARRARRQAQPEANRVSLFEWDTDDEEPQAPVKGPPITMSGGRTGAARKRLPAVLEAQWAFRHRNANHFSFEVPEWFSRSFKVGKALLRKKVKLMKPHERELVLLVRLSYLNYVSEFQKSRGTKGMPRGANHFLAIQSGCKGMLFGACDYRRNDDKRRCALRTASRRFIQSDLTCRPVIMRSLYAWAPLRREPFSVFSDRVPLHLEG